MAATLIYNTAGLLIALVAIAITFLKWRFGFWKRKGLPTLNPQIPFGDAKKQLTGKYSFGEQLRDFYQQFRARGVPHGGVFVGLKPIYIPVEPDLIKQILVKDFQYFVNHGVYSNPVHDPLSANLFNLENTEWRNMRMKLTPTFSSGKMKMMFQTLADCTLGLRDILDRTARDHVPVDIKDILGRFTTDVIGSCAFGLECNSLKDPDAEFRTYGKKIFENTFVTNMRILLSLSLPHDLLRRFGMRITRSEVEKFFMDAVKRTVAFREKNNIYRKDFLHLLLQLKNRGSVEDDEKVTDENGIPGEKALTIEELAAQAFIFFAAGFETSSTTMTWALYELARTPDMQEKLRKEINQVFENYQDELTYDGIMEMTFMDKVINETLRRYPAIPILPRRCTKNYRIPGTDIIIDKNLDVIIPIFGLHMDEKYYPNPEKFDPERFSEENKNSRNPFVFLPFGEGPRHCIGLRFGMLQSKVGLATILKNYKITLNKRTKTPIEFEKGPVFMVPKGGVWINAEKIK